MSDAPRTGTGRFGCPRCGARFASVGDKRRHLRNDNCEETLDG